MFYWKCTKFQVLHFLYYLILLYSLTISYILILDTLNTFFCHLCILLLDICSINSSTFFSKSADQFIRIFHYHTLSSYCKYSSFILSFLKKLFGENKLVKSVSFVLLRIKSVNTIQKYPHIIESYGSIS